MDEKVILRVLADQREELKLNDNEGLCARAEEDLFEWESGMAQVVIGVRRSGKSTLCHKVLQGKGVYYGYVDFDDDRLAKLQVEDLDTVLSCLYQLYGTDMDYLFLDEIQNVDGWYLFVNRLLRSKMHVVLTGSNAKLLSGELSSHLTGRYNEIRLLPFSFAETCLYKGVNVSGLSTKAEAERKIALNSYLQEGGLPELMRMKSDRTKRNYAEGLIETIITKDIAKRYKIKNVDGLRRISNHLINNICQTIDYAQLVAIGGVKSDNTVRKYVGYLTQAYLVQKIQKFSYKSKERVCNEKIYVIDTGFIANRENNLLGEGVGWRLENVVYTELKRRYVSQAEDIYYYKPDTRGKEVDFVVCRQGRVLELIQVSYSVSDPATLKREVSALASVSDALKCDVLTLVTLDESRQLNCENKQINLVNAVEWLLRQYK